MSNELESFCAVGPADEAVVDTVRGVAEDACRVAAEVLETMFFAQAVPAACSHDWLSSAVSDRIAFEGSHSGELRLSVSAEAADSLASAFLGLDPPELTEALRAQVILELTNILCGAIMSHLWPESKLALRPPEIAAAKPPDFGSALHRCFELPEGKLALWLEWQEGPLES